jgi:BlaI family penicillinase repressor
VIKDLPKLTAAELEVIKVLWATGAASAREIHEGLNDRLGWSYSTTRTTTERMVGKGLVSRSTEHGLTLYRACISRAAGLARSVLDFAHRVVGASPLSVLPLFVESDSLSESELEELQALLEKAEREG